MSTLVAPAADSLARVQVWFGEHLVIDWTGPADKAPAYAAGMRRRFASMRVDGPRPLR